MSGSGAGRAEKGQFRLAPRRSAEPTKTLREEFLDHVAPFESVAAAQEGIEGWVQSYNHHRPHQSLDMATPASRFRPYGPTRIDTGEATPTSSDAGSMWPLTTPERPLLMDVIEPPALATARSGGADGATVEFEARVPPTGEITVRSGRQAISLRAAIGRVVTVWADLRSVHVLLDGHVARTVASRLLPEDLRHLSMRGARPGSLPPPAPAALRRRDSATGPPEGGVIEVSRIVTRYGRVTVSGHQQLIGFAWAGRTITLRLDGHLMHAIADNALIGSWPCPHSLRPARHGSRRESTRHAASAATAAGRITTSATQGPRKRPDHGRGSAHQTRATPSRQARDRRH